MWDDPVALNRLSVALLLATLLFAAGVAVRLAAERWLPVRVVEVRGAGHVETRRALGPVVSALRGGVFTVDLDQAKQGFEALPWVRAATVQRRWPNRLSVHLEEHVPAAAWNDLAVMNVRGEVFPVRPWANLPRVRAPEGMEKEVALRYGEFHRWLAPHGLRIAGLQVDARRAWRIELADGVSVDLGRDRLDERLRRFVTFYPLAAATVPGIRRVDMRYPNGFAVQGKAST